MIQQVSSGKLFKNEEAIYVIHFFRHLYSLLPKFVHSALCLELTYELDLLFSICEYLALFENVLKCLSEMPGKTDQSFLATVTSDENEYVFFFLIYIYLLSN